MCTSCREHLEETDQKDVRARLHRLPVADNLFKHCFSLWTFDAGTTLQRLQHAVKYQNKPAYGLALGQLLGEGYSHAIPDTPDLIIPIPLHRSRELSRGYNQSRELAKGIAKVMEVPVCTVLERSQSTISQTKLSREERWANVASAFSLADTGFVVDTNVLLVDDVLTTGSTLTSAAQCLAPHTASVSLTTVGFARV